MLLGHADRFSAPEVLCAWPCLSAAGFAAGGVGLLQQTFKVGPLDPHAATNSERRKRALVDPVPDRLLVELERLRDLGDGQERLFNVALCQYLSSPIETNWNQFQRYIIPAAGGRDERARAASRTGGTRVINPEIGRSRS